MADKNRIETNGIGIKEGDANELEFDDTKRAEIIQMFRCLYDLWSNRPSGDGYIIPPGKKRGLEMSQLNHHSQGSPFLGFHDSGVGSTFNIQRPKTGFSIGFRPHLVQGPLDDFPSMGTAEYFKRLGIFFDHRKENNKPYLREITEIPDWVEKEKTGLESLEAKPFWADLEMRVGFTMFLYGRSCKVYLNGSFPKSLDSVYIEILEFPIFLNITTESLKPTGYTRFLTEEGNEISQKRYREILDEMLKASELTKDVKQIIDEKGFPNRLPDRKH